MPIHFYLITLLKALKEGAKTVIAKDDVALATHTKGHRARFIDEAGQTIHQNVTATLFFR